MVKDERRVSFNHLFCCAKGRIRQQKSPLNCDGKKSQDRKKKKKNYTRRGRNENDKNKHNKQLTSTIRFGKRENT